MASQNSQQRSPRSSAKSKTTQAQHRPPTHQPPFNDDEQEQYADHSFDHVARVRAAKEVAQRKMEEFGDVSEYDITVIHGQLKEEPDRNDHPLLDFERGGEN